MARKLVTIATDGLRDFVILPTGEKLTMGPISMLQFVSQVAPSSRAARSALDVFLKEGSALLMADTDLIDKIFMPKRRIWAGSASPLISGSDRTPSSPCMGKSPILQDLQIMIDSKTFSARLAQVEEVVARLDSARKSNPALQTQLRQMASKLHTVQERGTYPKTASMDTFKANEALASGILDKVEVTSAKIDQLVTSGRKFNASRAKSDLFAVASKVAEVLNATDLAQPWVTDELSTLSAEADRLHGLFAPATV